MISLVDEDGKLRAYGFVVGQEELLQTLPREALRPGRFAVFQVKLRELENRTGLDFGDAARGRRAREPGGDGTVRARRRRGADRPAVGYRARALTGPEVEGCGIGPSGPVRDRNAILSNVYRDLSWLESGWKVAGKWLATF